MSTNFKVGDWIFCEYKLHVIEEMEGETIKAVADGYIIHSSYSLNDRCFPLNKEIKRISEHFEQAYTKIHELSIRGLNFPDIHRWLVKKWCEACNNKDDNTIVTACMNELNDFTDNTIERCKILKEERVGDIKLMRE